MVREIIRPDKSEMTIHIPDDYIGRRVEYIVFPLEDEESTIQHKRSLKGALHKYADPAKREQEENAWIDHVKQSYRA